MNMHAQLLGNQKGIKILAIYRLLSACKHRLVMEIGNYIISEIQSAVPHFVSQRDNFCCAKKSLDTFVLFLQRRVVMGQEVTVLN